MTNCDVLCYKQIPIIYRTSLLQNSLKVEILQCFILLQIPFTLTLRVWDVYLLEGERVLTGMAYNLLKMHRRNLSRLGMDDILQYLQVSQTIICFIKITKVSRYDKS